MWTWNQSTGEMADKAGKVVGKGYAGNRSGFNNALMQNILATGPLPCGTYTIGLLEANHGKLDRDVAKLLPSPKNTMFGRSDFYIHGRKSLQDLGASEGCIVLDHEPRLTVLTSTDRALLVINGLDFST